MQQATTTPHELGAIKKPRLRGGNRLALAVLILAGTISIIGASGETPSVAGPAAPLLAGTVDSSRVTAPKYRSVVWTAPTSSSVKFSMSWTGAGALKMDLRLAANQTWISHDTSTANPKSITASVTAGTAYQVGVWSTSGVGTFSVQVTSAQRPPNILIILTDDQRPDALTLMPKVQKRFATEGVKFARGYVTTPSCCPSRAALLTGRYDHNNGVIRQAGPAFNEDTSIAKYLDGAGYNTGFIGKYVHYYPLAGRAPYWDRWTYWRGGYEDVEMNFDGNVRTSNGYSTRIAFDTAISYVNSWEQSDQTPWMMVVAPTAPHLVGREPPPPEPRFETAAVPPMVRNPSSFETDVSDKPPFIYCCDVTEAGVALEYTGMTRAAYTIDDGVDTLMKRLAATGELDNTLAFFLSDNGIMFGDHDLDRKFLPYKNSVGVPFLARWPGKITPGTVDTRFIGAIDIAPTALAAAGVTPAIAMDGRNIFGGAARTRRLTEYWQDDESVSVIPDWASLTTSTYEYNEYYRSDSKTVRFREYYDLVNDPFELVNLLADGNPNNDPGITAISSQLKADRACKGASCP